MHEFCSHCYIRKTSLFEINQQLGEQMENLRAENENLKSQLKYYETADVQEVRHGHWIDRIAYEHEAIQPWMNRYYCSVCHWGAKESWFYYCPNCGARMDEKE